MVGALTACECGSRGAALAVTVETVSTRPDGCFLLEVQDASGAVLATKRLEKKPGRDAYVVGVLRKELPVTVTLVARALRGADCNDPNGVSPAVVATFIRNEVVPVTLHLDDPADDADQDGYVSVARGGGDCADGDGTVFPGAAEDCFGEVDHDCNGLASCADPACAGMPCAGVAARLRITSAPLTLRAGECSPAVTVQVQDALGARTAAPAGRTLGLSGAPLVFFSDPACTQAVTSLPLSTDSRFHLVTPQGMTTLQVASAGLMGDTQQVVGLPPLPVAVRFANPPRVTTAGLCSQPLELELVDFQGQPIGADAALDLTLTHDADGGFGLYGDATCTQATATLALDAGASRGVLYYSGTRAGLVTVWASAPSLDGGLQYETVSPGPVASVSITSPPRSLLTSECSPASVVVALDAFGNPVTPQTWSVTAADAGLSVFTGAGCTTAGASSTFAVTATEEGSFTLVVTADGITTTQPLTVRRPFPPGTGWRWPLTVTTGSRAPFNGYAGYTLSAGFDSRGDVDAGRLSATGADLRAFFWTGADWREVDRLVANPNAANTTVRFASQTDLPSSAVDRRYSLFSGAFDGGVAMADAGAVYLFAEDFEGATLSRWTIRSGGWQRATDRPRTGAGSLKLGTETDADRVIEVNPALNEADVMVEAWWNTSNTGDTDFSQVVRLQPAAQLTCYETNLEDNGGWSLARMSAGAWTRLVPTEGTVTNNTWIRVGLSTSGSNARVWRDGVQIVPTGGVPHVLAATVLGPGNIGFRKWDLGGSIWLDDVTVRRYTEPEPVVTVGAAQPP